MADTQKVEKTSVLLTGIDELSPKLAGLRGKVDGFKKNLEQAGLGKLDISGLFNGGSVITPFVDGIESAAAFQGKLAEVNESAKNVEAPSAPKNATQDLNVFSSSMGKVSAAVDAALLPAVGALTIGLEPLLNGVGSLLSDNPKLAEGLAASAIAFSAIQTAVTGATQVFDLMSTVLKTSPIMLIAMGIALAAGLIVANWGPITGFFASLWETIKAVAAPVLDFFKTMFSFSILGQIIENWTPLTGLFSAIWALLKALTVPAIDFLKGLFDWTPMGMIVNNWGAISGFFDSIWTALQPAAQAIKDFFGRLFDFSPLGMIVNNWGAIGAFFEPIWAALQTPAQLIKDFFSSLFEWSPMGQIAANWQPIGEVFSAVWGVVQALAAPVLEFLHGMFEWTPLGQIIKNWEPITEWFSGLWKKLQEVIAPIKELFEGGFAGVIAQVTGKVEGLTQAQRKTNAEGKGELAPAFFGASSEQSQNQSVLPGNLPQKPSMLAGSLPQSSSALIQQSAANNRTQLEGGLTVRFENAPAGMRTDQPQTNQPTLALNSRIGYRSLSLGGSNELA